jgi:hypothetical protein
MDNGQSAFDYFVSQGLAPHQAAGIVGNLQGDSGQGLNPGAVNPADGSDGSDSIGIGQWNGSRARALKDYASSKGTPWSDLNTQLEFLHSELKGPEAGAYGRLMAAQTPEEAGQAMLAYERPKDWHKPGAHPERARYAAVAYSAYGNAQPAVAAITAPVNFQPQQRAEQPIFAARPQDAPQQEQAAPAQLASFEQDPLQPSPFQQFPAAHSSPIFISPRKSIDISKLRAAFSQPIFAARG